VIALGLIMLGNFKGKNKSVTKCCIVQRPLLLHNQL